jgi:hypothetical protein
MLEKPSSGQTCDPKLRPASLDPNSLLNINRPRDSIRSCKNMSLPVVVTQRPVKIELIGSSRIHSRLPNRRAEEAWTRHNDDLSMRKVEFSRKFIPSFDMVKRKVPYRLVFRSFVHGALYRSVWEIYCRLIKLCSSCSSVRGSPSSSLTASKPNIVFSRPSLTSVESPYHPSVLLDAFDSFLDYRAQSPAFWSWLATTW